MNVNKIVNKLDNELCATNFNNLCSEIAKYNYDENIKLNEFDIVIDDLLNSLDMIINNIDFTYTKKFIIKIIVEYNIVYDYINDMTMYHGHKLNQSFKMLDTFSYVYSISSEIKIKKG